MPVSISQSDELDPARATALLATLGKDLTVSLGDALPPFFHQIYFWSPAIPSELGRDGHPKVGGLIPDIGLPRRMWAGGRLTFATPLRAGLPATKTTCIEAIQHKTGRTGKLGLVTLRHEIRQDDALCLTEWQNLVYREDASKDAPRPKPPIARTDEEERHEITFDSTLLFRYSALTFNGHRIHYDAAYGQKVEGYDGLVVHGPLLAQLLMLMAQDGLGPLTEFTYRATAPLMHFETATLCRAGRALWVRGPDGRLCMQATA